MTFAEKIKSICKEKGIKISHMEKDLGFSNGYILTLKDRIPTDRAMKIAEYLKLPTDYFMPEQIKKSATTANPLIEEIMLKASNLSESELQELLSFANYIQSKHSNT